MAGVNLHSIVRGAVNALHPDMRATLYRSTGQSVRPGGLVKSAYGEGVQVKVQVQSEGATVLYHADRVGMEEITRKMYLFCAPGLDLRVAGILRPLSRGGDMIKISPEEQWFSGTWWLVDGVVEDFSASGWSSVRATLQVNPPDLGE